MVERQGIGNAAGAVRVNYPANVTEHIHELLCSVMDTEICT